MKPVTVTATGALSGVGRRGILKGVLLLAGSGAAATLRLYDGVDATGTLVAGANALTNEAYDFLVVTGPGIEYENGLYAVLSGASAVAVVYVANR